jgi:acyl-CoA thioesterase I
MTLTKALLAGITMVCSLSFASADEASAAQGASAGTIAAVGDSLTAGYSLKESEAYPALLEKKLHQAGYNWRVINAGISGETSSGTLSRIDWILKLKPDIVILEIGANDGLRAVDPKLVHKNIEKIVSTLQAKNIEVVLCGMQMLRNLGYAYTTEFTKIYPRIAKDHNLILVPFFLDKVAGEAGLNIFDGVHPNAKGYRIIADTVYPYAVKAIQKKQKK